MVMFWVSLLAISILLYVLLDGVDLGVGVLFGLANGEARRGSMLSAVAPIWDGNETWLVVTAVILWAAFPIVYATLLSAFYLPLIVMLLGLILRGVAFEFRYKTQRLRWIWDLSFVGGSLIATFIQGMTVGALVEGLQFTNGEYSGGEVGWLTPFAVLCGIGLCLGYALLGACWLARKCEAEVRDRRAAPDTNARGRRAGVPPGSLRLRAGRTPSNPASLDRSAVSVRISGDRSGRGNRTRAQHPETQRPLAVLYGRTDLFIGIRHAGAVLLALHDPVRHYRRPGRRAAVQSLVHILGVWRVVFPLMLLYTVISYTVFRGKVGETSEYGHH